MRSSLVTTFLVLAVWLQIRSATADPAFEFSATDTKALVDAGYLEVAEQANGKKRGEAASRFRTLIASPFNAQFQPAELQLLATPKKINATRQALEDRLDPPETRRKLIAAGVLEVETANAGARALREAVMRFRQRINSKEIGDLSKTELERLDQNESAVDTFADFQKIDYPQSERTLLLPARLVSIRPDSDSVGKSWVPFSSPDAQQRIRIHLVLHPSEANTAVSLAATLMSTSTREKNAKIQFDYLQLTRDDFLIKMRTTANTYYLNHSAGWERNGKVFAVKFTANLDIPPMLDLPATVPPDTAIDSEADPEVAKKGRWLQMVRIIWNLIISDMKPLNGWQPIDATKCRALPSSDGSTSVAIIYGTDRAARQTLTSATRIDADTIYSTQRDTALHVGCAIVRVPKSSQNVADIRSLIGRGAVGSPTNEPAKHFDVVAHELAVPLKPGEDRELVLRDQIKFRSERALLFVHGYNSSFADSILRAAQIASATKYGGRVFVFSWPSQESKASYISDMDNAEQAEISLQAFLKTIFREPSGLKADVLAHSMGSQILMRSLTTLNATFDRREGSTQDDRIRLGQVIFAAPDVSELVFRSKLPLIRKYADRITVYSSGNDGPLKLSSWLRGNVARAGLVSGGKPIRFADVQMIDITGTTTHWLNPKQYLGDYHSAFAYEAGVLQDIQGVLTPGWKLKNPMERAAAAKVPNKFSEAEFVFGSGTKYWILRPEKGIGQ